MKQWFDWQKIGNSERTLLLEIKINSRSNFSIRIVEFAIQLCGAGRGAFYEFLRVPLNLSGPVIY